MFGSLYVYTYKLPEILVSLYVRTNLLIFQEMISRFPRKFVRSKKFRSRPISGFPRKFVRLIKFRSRPISGTTGRSHLGGGCCYYHPLLRSKSYGRRLRPPWTQPTSWVYEWWVVAATATLTHHQGSRTCAIMRSRIGDIEEFWEKVRESEWEIGERERKEKEEREIGKRKKKEKNIATGETS